ncbi:hypothetical protein PENTCL1PPCAC_533, partial [Pristionchus entomophagus]
LSLTMTSRLTLPLSLLFTLLAPSLAAPTTVPKGATVPNIWTNSHYDFEHCGKPVVGRARRGYGDDYDDGIGFNVDGVEEAERGEMPWAVAITTRVPSSPSSPRLCAGTLVSRRHVLSAAHCLSTSIDIPVQPGYPRCNTTDHFDLDDFIAWSEVKFGGECLSKRDSSCDDYMVAKSVKIKNITLFPFFADDCSRGSDLVIIELEHDVDVPHACLPHLHDISGEDLKNSTISPFHTFRWTSDKTKGIEYADRLRKSSLTLVEDRCTHKWPSLSPDVLCAADSKHITQCMGDSGAGLMTITKKRAFAIGVLSSSSVCAPEAKEEERGESRFTDIRLFSASIDLAIGTVGKLPDGIIL